MSVEDYILSFALVALVIRQVRGKKLTAISLLWPVGLVLAVGAGYLHGIPSAGNDLVLALVGALVGAILGCLCGLFTRIRRLPNGSLLATASGLAAVLWVLGVGTRIAFALYADHGGEPAIAQFSVDHHITDAAAWAACLILMSLAEVIGRSAVLAVRGYRMQVSGLSQERSAAA